MLNYLKGKNKDHQLEHKLRGCEKIFVPDTNQLIQYPETLVYFLSGNWKTLSEMHPDFDYVFDESKSSEPNSVLIPAKVIEELDHLKDYRKHNIQYKPNSANEKASYSARIALKTINKIIERTEARFTDLYKGIELENGGILAVIKPDEKEFARFARRRLFEGDNDIEIIYSAYLAKKLTRNEKEVTLITKDNSMKLKAGMYGLDVKIEQYRNEEFDENRRFSGMFKIELPQSSKDRFREAILRRDVVPLESLVDNLSKKARLYPNMILDFFEPIIEGESHSRFGLLMPSLEHIRPMLNLMEYIDYIKKCRGEDQHDDEQLDLSPEFDIKALNNKMKSIINSYRPLSIRPETHILKIKKALDDALKTQGIDEKDLRAQNVQDLFRRFPYHRNIFPREYQIPYFELLLTSNQEVSLLTVSGTQGTGKSLLALMAGLYQIDRGTINNIVMIRSTKEIGDESFGYLPGNLEDKMGPWIKTMNNQLEEIFENQKKMDDLHYKEKLNDFINTLFRKNLIEILPSQYIQGRTIGRQSSPTLVIVEESQNFDPDVAYIIQGRIGKNSKAVFIDDPGPVSYTHLTLPTKRIV